MSRRIQRVADKSGKGGGGTELFTSRTRYRNLRARSLQSQARARRGAMHAIVVHQTDNAESTSSRGCIAGRRSRRARTHPFKYNVSETRKCKTEMGIES